jgi:hypothetical protein
MARSTEAERVRRVNAAHQLLSDEMTLAEASEVLAERFSVGMRQAYRYLQEACEVSSPLEPPEPKEVFTVKLPISLIERLRTHPRRSKQSLSDFVCQALKCALEEESSRRGRTR